MQKTLQNKEEHYVYRYVLNDTGEIIYVGKTDASLRQRIEAHLTEPKFRPYIGRWQVEFIKLANSVETDIVEKFLINQLKPVINEKDCVAGVTSMAITLPDWRPYSEYAQTSVVTRDNLVSAQAEKVCKAIEAVRNAEGNAVVLPYIITTGVCANGVELFSEDVRVVSGGYEYTVAPSAKEYVRAHGYQMCADAWAECRKKDGGAASEYAIAKEIAARLEDFRRDRYDAGLGLCIFVLPPEYEECALYFSSIMEKRCEGIYEVNPDGYGEINSILEHLAFCELEQELYFVQ